MATNRLPLSRTEEAFTLLVLEEHQAAVRNANALRDRRMEVLRVERGIPVGVDVAFTGRTEQSPAYFQYEMPDIAPPLDEAPPAPEALRGSEKSTEADASTGA